MTIWKNGFTEQWHNFFNDHVIHFTTMVPHFMTIVKMIITLSPVMWYLNLWPQWLTTEISGSIVFVGWGLPVVHENMINVKPVQALRKNSDD